MFERAAKRAHVGSAVERYVLYGLPSGVGGLVWAGGVAGASLVDGLDIDDAGGHERVTRTKHCDGDGIQMQITDIDGIHFASSSQSQRSCTVTFSST